MPNVFLTGCDRGLGLSLAQRFAEEGWRVFAGSYLPDWPQLAELAARYPARIQIVPIDIASDASVKAAMETVQAQTDTLDLVINNAAVASLQKDRGVRDPLDYEDLLRLFEVNTLGALRVSQTFLPLLRNGELKRLCFVSSEAGSINRAQRTAWYGYCLSKTALNRGVLHLFQTLRPEGFTFRLFHPGWMRTYMSGARNEEAELEPDAVAALALTYFLAPTDEDHLVLRDWQGNPWPW